jgi:hypothetical protein
MAVKTADPAALELDAVFKAAMEGPAKPRTAEAPSEADKDAPHGRDEDGNALAPFGWTKPQRKHEVSRPRLTRGRPTKDDEARTGTIIRPPADTKPRPPADLDADYAPGLSELADALWFGLTGVGMLGPKIPVIGRFIPEHKIAAEAYVFRAHKDKLCGALSLSAKHNASAARFCEKATQGEVTWVAMAAFMVMPFAVHTAAILRGGDALSVLGEHEVQAEDGTVASVPNTLEFLAEQNQAAVDSFVANMEAMAKAQQAEANAGLNGHNAGGNDDQPG